MTEWRPEIEGWSSDILPYYESLAEQLPDGSHFVEVGVYKGRSALWLAECLAKRGKNNCEILAVDSWTADWCPTLWEDFKRNYRMSSEQVRWLVWPMRTYSEIGARFTDDGWADVLFIDGDHNYESVKADIAAWRGKVKLGGIISGHDYSGDMYGSFPGVDQAVHEAFGRENVLKPSGSVWRIK